MSVPDPEISGDDRLLRNDAARHLRRLCAEADAHSDECRACAIASALEKSAKPARAVMDDNALVLNVVLSKERGTYGAELSRSALYVADEDTLAYVASTAVMACMQTLEMRSKSLSPPHRARRWRDFVAKVIARTVEANNNPKARAQFVWSDGTRSDHVPFGEAELPASNEVER